MRSLAYLLFFVPCFLFSNLLIGQGFYQYMSQNKDASFQVIKTHLDAYYDTHDIGKGSGYKQYTRWQNEAGKYLTDDGQLGNKVVLTDQAKVRYLKKHPIAEQRSLHANWQFEGPETFTNGLGLNGGLGRINRVAFHPTQPNTIFGCAPVGGLWRSNNNGGTWECLTSHIPHCGAVGLAIDYTNTNIMYLLTGDGDGFQTYSKGVLKSIDGGINWDTTALKSNHGSWTYKLLMHPTNPSILFAATSKGIYRTSDGGQTWPRVKEGWFVDIEFMPTNPSIVYAVTDSLFFKSTNNGQSFIEKMDVDFPVVQERIEIAVTPGDSSYVYLLFGGHESGTGGGTFTGVFHSVDFGEDFVMQSTSPNVLGYEITAGDSINQADYDLALAADPNNPDIIYLGGINNWRSFDNGQTWELLSHWADVVFWPYVHGDIHHLIFKGSKLYVGTDGGIYSFETTNGQWNDLSAGMSILQPYDIDVVNNNLLAGTQDNGTQRWDVSNSTNALTEWGGDGFDCMWDPSNTSTFYVSWQNDLLITNTNGGSFGGVGVPGYSNGGQYWYLDLMMHPQNFDTIYIGVGHRGNISKEVFRSYNRGSDWFDMNAGLSGEINALAQGTNNPDIIFAASKNEFVRTKNAHAVTPTWETIFLPAEMPGRIEDIAVDPDDVSIVFLCLNGYTSGKKVYMSSDTGSTWTNISGSIPNVPTFCLQTIPGNENSVYLGTDMGVFHRTDNTVDWRFIPHGMPSVRISDLDTDNGRLFAGTFGRGVWSIPLTSTCQNIVNIAQSDPGVGIKNYYALSAINSSQVVQGTFNTNIKYVSEGTITLTTGFHAKANNLFEAIRDHCPN